MFAEKKMIRNMRIAMLSLLGATASTWVFADALVISNMAVGEYKEEGSTVVQVARSNLVQTTVIPVYNLGLKDNRTEYVRPGQAVYYHHVLTNTGNERDLYNLLGSQIAGGSFTHSNIEIYLAAIVVFVGRMFNNLAIIRRYYLERWNEKMANKNNVS